jgi:hypothetical protein
LYASVPLFDTDGGKPEKSVTFPASRLPSRTEKFDSRELPGVRIDSLSLQTVLGEDQKPVRGDRAHSLSGHEKRRRTR